MSRAHKFSNLVGVAVPFVAFLVAIVLLWNTWVDWSDLAVLAIMYVLTGLGVTLGFHRLLTHRSFQTYKPVEYVLAGLGSMAVQGPVMTWVADHRKHHAHTDREGDPHSPHGHGGGFRGAVAGLWYAHMGWLFDRAGQAAPQKYAKDLYEDRGMRVIQRAFLLFVLAGIALPFGLGWGSAERSRTHSPAPSGAARCGSSSCTTSPGRSTRSAISSAPGASRSTTTPRTSSGSRSSPSGSPGTTTITPSPVRRCTACGGGSSIRPGGSSAR
jgi:fatty acid desaturase